MKIRHILALLFFMFCTTIFAQGRDYINEMEQNDLQIRQKPNTEGLLSDYLHSANIKEDTIFAILYSPAECFRCEAAIPAFYDKLKRNNPNNKLLLITAYGDSKTASWYNSKNNYKADYYIYDTKSVYSNIFSFNSEGMYGLYILKLVPKEGVFVTGGQYTVLGAEFVKQLVLCKKRIAPHMYELDKKDSYKEVADQIAMINVPMPKWKQTDIEVNTKDGVEISSIYDIPKIENGHLFFNDMLNNGIMLFNKENGLFKFKRLFQADEAEKKKFVSVPDKDFRNLVKQGQVFYIALSANMLDSSHIGISYSLPKILREKVGTEWNFSFYNAPAVLIRDINNYTSGKMISPDFDLEHSKYFYLHFVFDLFNNKLWTGSEKLTWPMDGFEKEDIVGQKDLDPFNGSFYKTFNPIIASFRINDGKCDGHYGKLERIQENSRTGYYYLNNVFAHEGKTFLYGNGYTGKLYVTDSLHLDKYKVYMVFDTDTVPMIAPDSTKFYTHEYGNLYSSYFTKCITTVKMDKRNIYCLVKHGMPRTDNFQKDRYSFVIVNRKNGKTKEYPLPSVAPAEYKCLGYGINAQDKHFNPFMFIKKDGKYIIRMLDI